MKLLSALILFFAISTYAQVYTQADIDICKSKFDFALEQQLVLKPINEIIVEIGKSFLGLEYEAGTLDKDNKEELVIHLTGLDCYTFLETSLVFGRLIKLEENSFEDYENELTKIRYRNGEITDYVSRLHYFSDWIFEMDKRSVVKDVTKDIGGLPYINQINFMSANPQYYKQLKSDPENVQKIKDIEKLISSRKYFYIPQDTIQKLESNIINGDIIGITTDIPGLDIAHTGIAVRLDDNRIHLLHAPNTGKKIQITSEPLAEYIKRNKKQTGIIVARPLEPSKN